MRTIIIIISSILINNQLARADDDILKMIQNASDKARHKTLAADGLKIIQVPIKMQLVITGYQPIPAGEHLHKCPLCDYVWPHGPHTSKNDDLSSHRCPNCHKGYQLEIYHGRLPVYQLMEVPPPKINNQPSKINNQISGGWSQPHSVVYHDDCPT